MITKNKIQEALENIYISPFETCNLNCNLCYTKKNTQQLSNQDILDFINRYKQHINLKSVLFCGGEVFTRNDFTSLVNELNKQNIFVTIITNGTIDKLKNIKTPQNCQLLVSLDGPQEIHDKNRGIGNFDKSILFIKKALSLNFPVEIMFLITNDSYKYIDQLPKIIEKECQMKININYITQKTFYYTDNHCLSNNNDQKPALTPSQIINIKKNYNTIPSKDFGCFQLSLQSNGNIYACCETPNDFAKVNDSIPKIVQKFKDKLIKCSHCIESCQGCCDPDFLCGYKRELQLASCLDVIQSFK